MSAPRLVLAQAAKTELFGQAFESIFSARRKEADEFYAMRAPKGISEDARSVQRQAFAGLLCPSSFIISTFAPGSRATPPDRDRLSHARRVAIRSGAIFTTQTLSPCRTSGSIPGTPLGILRSTAFLSRSRSGLRQGTTDAASSRVVHASEWAIARVRMGVRDVNPPVHAWRRGASTRSKSACAAKRTGSFSKASSTNFCSTLPGG